MVADDEIELSVVYHSLMVQVLESENASAQSERQTERKFMKD